MRHGILSVLSAGVMLALATTSGPAQAQSAAPATPEIRSFLDTLSTGDTDAAVSAVMDASPLWQSQTGAKEQMTAQVGAAAKVYGPMKSYECLPVLRTGSLILRQYCFAQHQNMVVRWQFDAARLPDRWSIAYFGFTDQAQSWPDGE
jgi:hypothetical protein